MRKIGILAGALSASLLLGACGSGTSGGSAADGGDAVAT